MRMANQAKGQARVFAFLASGKLSHQRFSRCIIFIWSKLLFSIANIKHAEQAVLIPKPDLFMLATQYPGLCCTLRLFFDALKLKLSVRESLYKIVEP